MKKVIYPLVVAVLAVGLFLGCAAPAPAPAPVPAPAPAPAPAPPPPPAEPVKFKCVVFCPVHELTTIQWWDGMEMINKEFAGEVEFELLGGPEVISTFEQHGATVKGVVDVCMTAPSYYVGVLPEAEIADYSDCEWDEMVAAGYLEDMRKMHEPTGLFYLFDTHVGIKEGRTSFYIFTNVPAETPWDMAGAKIRVFPAIKPFISALGGDPILMAPADIYTALERGVIDGFVDINVGIVDDYHYEEICDYFIPYGFYHTSLSVLINLDSWNRLPKDLQDRITAFAETKVVAAWQEYFNRTNPTETQKIIDAGIVPLEFSPADADEYLTTAYRAGWEFIEEKSPGFIAKYGDKYWKYYR